VDAAVPQRPGVVRVSLSPLRRFVLAALLWLPSCFTLWAVFASAIVWPIARLTDLVLTGAFGELISDVVQLGARLEVETTLQTAAGADGRIGLLVLEGNPLVYAWCLALFAGLVMATPLERRQWLGQLAIGLPLLLLTSTWGAVFDVLKLLSFDAGPLGAAAVARLGLAPDAVALGYQFGYLILPAVTPVTLWVLLNRAFLEQLVGWTAEPGAAGDGPSATAIDTHRKDST
jgi:hypothetical protein